MPLSCQKFRYDKPLSNLPVVKTGFSVSEKFMIGQTIETFMFQPRSISPGLVARTKNDLGSLWLPEDSRETTSKGDSTVYVCSMDPDTHQDHPGSCPRCGDVVESPDVVLFPKDDVQSRQRPKSISNLSKRDNSGNKICA